jgi:hypothetical protein
VSTGGVLASVIRAKGSGVKHAVASAHGQKKKGKGEGGEE